MPPVCCEKTHLPRAQVLSQAAQMSEFQWWGFHAMHELAQFAGFRRQVLDKSVSTNIRLQALAFVTD